MNWPRWNPKYSFVLVLALAFLAGLFLRTYLLAGQVFADDEWHGFYYVIGKSPFWLLTHFSIPGATCIPLNLYTWALGATIGWSETSLRLPSLLCGLLCMLVGPWLCRDLFGTRRAVFLALLLAASPVLIFYSRICRPYSAVALLAFSAVLFAACWMQTGRPRFAILFGITGVLAVYFHLFAIVTVAAPILAVFAMHICSKLTGRPGREVLGPPLSHWIVVTIAMAAALALLVLPAFIHSLEGTFFNIARAGTFRWQSLPKAALLVSGTGQPVLAALFWVAFIIGAVEQCRRNPWIGGMLVSLYPLHLLALILSKPDSVQSAILLVRYCIPLVPVGLLFVSCGVFALLEAIAARISLRNSLQAVIAFGFAAALVVAGPLPQCYVAPNNFTSHGAYQHHYGPIDWSRSFSSDFTPAGFTLVTVVRADEVSPFYKWLGRQPGSKPIVEYPMLVGDHFNPLYHYQHFHHRPVIVGYTTNMAFPTGLAEGNVYGNTFIDQVLTLVPDKSRLHFRNLVDMDDLAAMKAKGAQYIVLHKLYEAQLPEVALTPPQVDALDQEYRKELGAPVYEDAHIVVFSFGGRSSATP